MPRKIAFSNKKKKLQLQEKRAKKRNDLEIHPEGFNVRQHTSTLSEASKEVIQTTVNQNRASSLKRSNKPELVSMFNKLTQEEITQSKVSALEPITRLPLTSLEVQDDSVFLKGFDIPIRPEWDYKMTKEQLEAQELRYFTDWFAKIEAAQKSSNFSLYEKNIEVWKQLWRVLEISDIFLLAVDIRYPLLYLPPTLYEYITKKLKKPLIVVLNKVDLVSKNTTYAWSKYLEFKFPGIVVVPFSCYKNENQPLDDSNLGDLKRVKKRAKKRTYNNNDSINLLETVKKLSPHKKNVSIEWEAIFQKIYKEQDQQFQNNPINPEEYQNDIKKRIDKEHLESISNNSLHLATDKISNLALNDESDTDSVLSCDSDLNPNTACDFNLEDNTSHQNESDSSKESIDDLDKQRELQGIQYYQFNYNVFMDSADNTNHITIGLIGSPNVGKSTIINSIMGRTVVSASRTPGHTKHFQTIHITKNLRLCDCPGIVFPCYVERSVQILMGLYNIAQVQEPYTPIKFLNNTRNQDSLDSVGEHREDSSNNTTKQIDTNSNAFTLLNSDVEA
ncbi:hypothetical protein BB561_000536 [Smittium simulii]|uniref:Guanine nucleotide-binding protein-like 1 n=1 Tax=Smittium simulii TaxID=133385 RepID=A0A2T9YYL2_9FUNG|nr:hypothetical protein BB561_000536 [Smittium simulii]